MAKDRVPAVRWLWDRPNRHVIFLCEKHKRWIGGPDLEEISQEEADVRLVMSS